MSSRSLSYCVVLPATPEEVFRLWTTPEGITSFFGVDGVVEPRIGGAYEVYFLPGDHPESDPNSTRGCRILVWEPPELVVFQWRSPPWAKELEAHAPSQWVVLKLRPVDGAARATRLSLQHLGFGEGELWDRVHEFFDRNWRLILERLEGTLEGAEVPGSEAKA